MEKKESKFKKGIILFLIITVITIVLLLVLTVGSETFEALKKLNPYGLLLLIGIWLALVFSDGIRFSILSYSEDKRIGIFKAIEILFIGNFVAAITPFQTGGLPCQLYVMNKEGIKPGRATALLLVRGAFHYIPLFIAAPFVAVRLGIEFSLYRLIAIYVSIIILGGFFAALVLLLRPKSFLQKIEGKKEKSKFFRFLAWMVEESTTFLDAIKSFFKKGNPVYLLLFSSFTVVFIVLYLLLPSAILYSLNIDFSLWRVIGIQILLSTILLYMPTPGASGIAEAIGALFFSSLCPKILVGIFVVIWRFFNFYLGAILGGSLFARGLTKSYGFSCSGFVSSLRNS